MNLIKVSITCLSLVLFNINYNKSLNKTSKSEWGFLGHKIINRNAVFLLPPEMLGFYKHNISYITESATKPDARRYVIRGEAPKHFIDLDIYLQEGDSIPLFYNQAVEKYGAEFLHENGIAPWHLFKMKNYLTRAFKQKNTEQILKLSAEIGHYISDIHVPLHTTSNYNGQKSNQTGIHSLWESRLPELYVKQYSLLNKRATYIKQPYKVIWQTVRASHACLDSVFQMEISASNIVGEDKKYVVEGKKSYHQNKPSKPFSNEYHKLLDGQVERRMKASIKMVADFWYTCWVDAGEPILDFTPAKPLPVNNNDTLYNLQLSRPHEY